MQPPRHAIAIRALETGRGRLPILDALLREAMSRHTVKDAVRLVSGAHGLDKRDVYARALAIKDAAE